MKEYPAMAERIDLSTTDLVSTDWLEQHLGQPGLRVLDATVVLDIDTWAANTGRRTYDAGHVPGAGFVDLIEDLSDTSADAGLPRGVRAYRLPGEEQFAAAAGALGIGDDTNVVAYDTTGGMWAARLWWMLRVFGHERVAVLDGGWAAWQAQGRPVSTEVAAVEPATFTARLRPELLATKEQVAEASASGGDRLVHALSPEMFRGEEQAALPRPGRIPGSVNVPFTAVYAQDGTFRPPAELREVFADVLPRAGDGGRVVTYCGGGIAASSDALALALLGVNAAVYDGSLVEWARDESLPMQVG
jgi:thiosulfate/3-mercaptopyruvate sulfurtransferase